MYNSVTIVFPRLRELNCILFKGEVPEIEISDDPTSLIQLDTSGIPLCVTLHKLGSKVLVDARRHEETCSRASMHVAVNQTGKVCVMVSVLCRLPFMTTFKMDRTRIS